MFHSTIGLVHLLSALLAMLTGAIVLLNNKGGQFHKRMGYAYVALMVTVNVTAFMIYHLFGKFGPFHILALVSMTCILGGMIPVFYRRQISSWMHWHYYFMNWSVVGLYAAFWAETFTRTLPMKQFWLVVVIATAITTSVGSYLIRKNAARFLPAKKVEPKDMIGV
jgi:uncharacterized membrane protein